MRRKKKVKINDINLLKLLIYNSLLFFVWLSNSSLNKDPS